MALATTLLAVTLIAAPASVLAKAPSGAQVRTAVRRAESSRSLWATINICNSHRYRDALGVRGQMPTLGFATSLSMRIQVDYYAGRKKGFVPISSSKAMRQVTLGSWSRNLQQAGAVFPFQAHSGLLNASIVFTWKRDGRVIGQTKRRTTAGHRDADYGSPPRYSAAQCRIP